MLALTIIIPTPRYLMRQSQAEGEAIGESLTNTFKARFKKIMDSTQVLGAATAMAVEMMELGLAMVDMAMAMAMTACLPQNSSETDTLKETAKMDCLERMLYSQGQATKAGEEGEVRWGQQSRSLPPLYF